MLKISTKLILLMLSCLFVLTANASTKSHTEVDDDIKITNEYLPFSDEKGTSFSSVSRQDDVITFNYETDAFGFGQKEFEDASSRSTYIDFACRNNPLAAKFIEKNYKIKIHYQFKDKTKASITILKAECQ